MNVNITGGTFYINGNQDDITKAIQAKLNDTSKVLQKEQLDGKIAAANIDPSEPRVHRVLTYGTYDLLHWGHINLLRRAKALGDYLIVALSTDEFNKMKAGKKQSYHDYAHRKMMLGTKARRR